jgi:hypothetical protein
VISAMIHPRFILPLEIIRYRRRNQSVSQPKEKAVKNASVSMISPGLEIL